MIHQIQVVWGETMATKTCGVTSSEVGGFFSGKVKTENVINVKRNPTPKECEEKQAQSFVIKHISRENNI